MIFLRSALFNLIFFGLSIVTMVCALPFALFTRRGAWISAQIWARVVIWLMRVVCGIHLRVTGQENLPQGAYVLAAKHQSAFDTIVWLLLVPNCTYVLKQELMRIPLYGAQAKKMGMIPVDRAGGGTALKAMVRATTAALKAGRQIVIFPEGTRMAPGERGVYQPGVVAIANALKGTPVVPAATNSGSCWGKRSFHKLPGTISVEILPPLPAGLPKAEMLARLEAAIEPATERLEAEIRRERGQG